MFYLCRKVYNLWGKWLRLFLLYLRYAYILQLVKNIWYRRHFVFRFLLFVYSGDTARRIGTSNRFNVRCFFFFFNKQKGAQFSRVWRYFVFLLIRAHFSSVLSMIETSLVDGIRRFLYFFCSFVCVMEIHTVVCIYMYFTYKCT